MTTIKQATISFPSTVLSKEGVVVLKRTKYDRMLKRILALEAEAEHMRQEMYMDNVIFQGEAELLAKATIVADSSDKALKQYESDARK